MKQNPENLKYASTHEWALLEAGQIVRVGITDFAQSELGDIVFIGLPDVGREVSAKEQLAVVESVKTASDLYSPVTGTVVEVNDSLVDAPEQVNDDAFGTWLFCIKADDPSELEQLMDAGAYQSMTEE
ncbi:glycine cleavage system protein GcvH [Methylomonas methanica]|uniref:Glycine cleavage system H protein n=1 Tax=Methylomonas methanica (strain DSM 25384 / MC09) TaxID=857087 RepID=G0A3F4_METMM|nr:glycine cleavage system protein GcvH [Methylomonas methanica]AEG00253.1 Glycine cleavage system H protein [Methylomonas methanica MC09]